MKKPRKDNIIVVGYGYIGSRICGLLSGQRRLQSTWRKPSSLDLHVSAIVEPEESQARKASKHFPDIPVVTRVDQLDEAILRNPNTFIRDFAPLSNRRDIVEFAQSHCIDVLLEKPVPLNCFGRNNDASSTRVGVGMSEVHNPVVAGLRFLSRTRFAKINSVRIVRVNSVYNIRESNSPRHRSGIEGGAFIDKMIHDLHLLERGYYFGTPATLMTFGAVKDAFFDPVTGEDICSDVELNLQTYRDDIQVRLISSWIGEPNDLARRLGVDESFVKQSILRYKLEGTDRTVENLKMAVITGLDSAGSELTLIANLQSRQKVSAGIWIIFKGSVEFREIRFNVPIIATTKAFAAGQYTSLEQVAASHKIAFDVSKRIAASSFGQQ